MKGMRTSRARRLATIATCGALTLAGIPSATYALSTLDNGPSFISASFASLTPTSVDPRVAELVAERGGDRAHGVRFTPAGLADRANRSVIVAVRVGDDEVRAISVRSAIDSAKEKVAAGSPVRIAPTRYNLGISRGYQSFAKAPVELSESLSDAAIPDLKAFVPTPGVAEKPSRFAARIAADDVPVAAARSSDPRPDQTVDVAGSYRLTRNLDVTAGVRYSQDRERLAPMADSAKQDAQAVYIGTQFRF